MCDPFEISGVVCGPRVCTSSGALFYRGQKLCCLREWWLWGLKWWHFCRAWLARADTWHFSTMSRWRWLKWKSWVTGSIRSFDLWVGILDKVSYYICVSPVFESKETVLRCVRIMTFCCPLNLRVVHYRWFCTIKHNCCRGCKRPRKD